MKTKNIKRITVEICVTLFLVATVIAPTIAMFSRITADGAASLFSSRKFGGALLNSVTTSLASTLISITLALGAAFAIRRTNIKGKGIFGTIFVIPMLIPSISHAYGLRALVGVNGSGLLSAIFGSEINIFGFWGIVAGSVMYSFPVAFLMFDSILSYEDGTPYSAAKVLGIPPVKRFTGITLPYMKKTLISAFFAVFTMTVTDYGVPYALHSSDFGYTLSMLMYDNVQQADYSSASVIGILLLIPAAVAFLADLIVPENAQSGFVGETAEADTKRPARVAAYIFCGLICVCVIAPVAAFAVYVFSTSYPTNLTFTFSHIGQTINGGAGTYLLNSLLYSVLAATLGSTTAFVCAYLTSRVGGALGKALHLVSITSVAIPGLVLGLSYIIFFKNSPIYGTIFIIVLANTIHFLASPYLMMYNTLGKVNRDLEDVGKTLGVGRMRIIFDVILPKVRFTVGEMFVYFFVNSMMTISAVSLLSPPAPKPLAVMISQAQSQMKPENAATISLMILTVNIAVKLVVSAIKKRSEKRSAEKTHAPWQN